MVHVAGTGRKDVHVRFGLENLEMRGTASNTQMETDYDTEMDSK